MTNIRPINAALAKKAAEELFEKPERIQSDLDALKLWISKSPHLKTRTDDQFLISFLRACKYSLEKVKEKLDNYHTIRSAVPEIMLGRNPNDPKIMEIIKLGQCIPLPLASDDAPRVLLMRPGVTDPSKHKSEDNMKINTMLSDILLQEDDNLIIAGQMGIIDLKGTTMAHFLAFNMGLMKKVTMMWQEGSPLRLKGFHYVNVPPFFETVFNMFKSFISEKNLKRLHIHGNNMDSLGEHFPKHILPTEYGGTAGPIQKMSDEWEKKLVSYETFFQDSEKYGTEEKKRVGRPKNAESLFGTDGSFRKLEFD